MPTSVGPKTVAEDSLVFAFDQDYFPHGWGLEQLAYNPTFEESGTKPSGPGVYSSGNYLGAMTQSIMQGGTFSYTGGDLSNYYSTNPEWRGWDNGGIGSTGGNWVYFNDILPLATSSLEDYIVDVRLRFVYVSLTGNGSTNPYVQIGRAYNTFKSIYYNEVGTDFKRIRFKFNGAQGNNYGGNNRDLTFGCTSADAMVEMDHFYVYRVNKSTGLKNLAGSSSINISNANLNDTGEIDYDGTDDYLSCDTPSISGSRDITFLCWVKSDGALTEARRGIFSGQNTPAGYISFFGYTGGSNGNILFETRDPVNSTYQGVSSQGFGIYSGNWNMVGFQVKPGHMSVFYANQEDGFYYNESVDTRPGFEFRNFNLGVDSSAFDWNGQIDGVRLFNRALTRAELEAHYKAFKSRYI